MMKSPFGFAIGAAAVLLALSPDARKAARKWAVKATEFAMELGEQAKDAAAGARNKR